MDNFNRRSFESGSGAGAGSGVMMFVAGALVGAAAALIFAPATGADARAFLGRRGRELADDVAARGKELADDVAARGKELWNEHGDRVTSAVKRGYETATGASMGESANGAPESSRSM